MNQRPRRKKQYAVATLEFASVKPLVNFLLSAVNEPEFSPGSTVYEQSLNRIYQGKPKGLFIRVQGHSDVIDRLDAMVKTGIASAKMHSGDQVPSSAAAMTIEQLMQRIHLKEAPQAKYRGGQLLTALWNANPDTLSEYVSYLWNLGANGMEVAFVRPGGGDAMPTHLVRIDELRHPGAFQSWSGGDDVTAELYVPMVSGQQNPYYVQWGFRFPIPGLERFVPSEDGLTLLRRIPGQTSTEWRVFRSRDIHFFRKPHDVLNLKTDRDSRSAIEMQPEVEEKNVPLEVAIVPRSRSALQQYWQVDREIDRLRRSLRNLEQNRARLVGRDSDEVYFAYRFEQHGTSELNPLLLRLLQQRMSTLSGYDYAFCKPKNGNPFHLVMSNRPSRALGFSVQVADRVYCQPKQWRMWGVNLYLPLDAELAPLIDSSDAVPMLQQMLDQSAQFPDDELEGGEGNYREWDAILWEPTHDNRITETRIKDKQPLMSRFRLLNSFQCHVARDVEQQTRDRLAERLRQTRLDVMDELDELETILLHAVEKRTAEVESQFEQMQKRLEKAEGLVTHLEPRVRTVTERLLAAPQDWVDFVRNVLSTHAEVVKPPLDAFEGLQNTLQKVETALLKTLTPRTKNLADAARRECDRLDKQFADFDEHLKEAQGQFTELESFSVKLSSVLAEVSATYRQIEQRVKRVRKLENEIIGFQKEIDQIDQREKEVETRHAHISQLRSEADKRSAEADRRAKEIREAEATLTSQVAELAELRRQIDDKGKKLSARLGLLARQVAGARDQDEHMNRLSYELNTRIGFVSAHARAVETWERHRQKWDTQIRIQEQELSLQVESMDPQIEELSGQNPTSPKVREHISKAVFHMNEARRLVNNNGTGGRSVEGDESD